MWEYLPAALKGVDSLEKTHKALSSIIKGKRGAKRTFVAEVQHNSTVCWLYLNRDADLAKVIEELKHDVYDLLSAQGFNFNTLKKAKIDSHPSLVKSNLKHLIGKRTEDLVDNIYKNIKGLKVTYKLSGENPQNRYAARVRNLQKRILLLIRHLKQA
jgi:hypothetical protein